MSLVASVYVGPPKHAAVPAVKTTARTIALTHKRQRVAGSQDQQLSRAASTINPPQQRSCRQLSSVMPTVRFKALPLSNTVAVNNIRTRIATTQILPATAAATTTITTAETATNHKLNPLPNAKNHLSKYQSYVTITTTAKSAPTRYGDETLTQRRTAEMLLALAAAKERAFLGGETPAQRTAARANLINYNLNGLMGDAKLVCDKQTICKCQQQQQRRQRRWAAAMKQQREVVRRKGTTRDVPAAATGALTAATARTMTKIDRLTHYPYRDKDYEKRGLEGAALAIATTTTARHLLHIVRKLCLVLALLLSILTLQHANCQQLMPLTAANKTATITTTTAAVAVDGTATVTAKTTTTLTAISVLQATIKTPTTMATAAFKKRAYTFLRAREEHLSSSSTKNLTTKTTQTEAHDHHRKPVPRPTKHGLTAATKFDHKADIVALELVRPASSSIKQQRTNGKSEEKKQFKIKEEEQKLQEVKEDEKVERRQVQEQEQLQEEEAKQQKQLRKEHKQQQLTSQLLQSGALQTPNESRANKHDQQRPNAATVDNNDNAAIIKSNVMTDNYKTANNIASGQLQLQFVQQRKDTQQQQQAEQAIEASVSSDIVTSLQPHNNDFTKNASSQAASAFASALTQRVAENHQNTPHQINATYAHSLIVFSNLIYNQANSRNIIHNHNSNNLITTTTAATSAALYDNAQHLHSDAQNEDHDNNNNNSAVANVEVDVDDIDVDAADVALMSNAPVAFKLAHSNNNNNNNNSNHLIEHKTASHRRARAAAVDVADVAVNVKNASANDNDGEVAQPNSFTDYEDNRKLLRLVMDGLGLRKLPDMTKGRNREPNWTAAEKDCLRELINGHIDIVESKRNNMLLIRKKKDAWESIRMDMLASGLNRDIPRLKQQWMRMKMGAKKAVAQVNRATAATGNVVAIPTINEEDEQIQSMISFDLQEDTILIDSNTDLFTHIPTCSPVRLCQASLTAGDGAACSTTLAAASVPKRNEGLLKRLQNLPKKSTIKDDVIKERQQQIAKESEHTDEIHSLRMEQLQAEIAHQSRMQKRQEEQSDELPYRHNFHVFALTASCAFFSDTTHF